MHNLKLSFDKILNITTSFCKGSIDADDNYYFYPNKPKKSDCTLIADKGYVSEPIQQDLFTIRQIKLFTPVKYGQHDKEHIPFIFMTSRKRIETLFFQFCDQLMLKRNYAKTTKGLSVRILCKITAVTVY